MSEEGLKLEASGPGRARPRLYKHALQHYAEKLQAAGMPATKYATRKLKRWIAAGRAKTPEDPPPFDELEMLADWWERCMDWRVPEYVAALRVGGGAAGDGRDQNEHENAPPASAAGSTAEVPAGGAAPLPGKPAADEHDGRAQVEMTYEAVDADEGLKQVRALCNTTFKQLELALKNNQTKLAATLRKEWQTLVGTLRQWEKDITTIQEKRGEVLRTKVLMSEMVSVMGVLSASFTNGMLALAEQLAPEMTPQDRRVLVLPLRDKIFVHLKGTRFRDAWAQVEQLELQQEVEHVPR